MTSQSRKRKHRTELELERPHKQRRTLATDTQETEAQNNLYSQSISNATLKRKDRTEEQPQDETPDKEYKVRDIIGETRTKYQVDWEDDPVTGEKFRPTWEPKSFVNAAAIEDWENKKSQKRQQERAAPKSRRRKTRSTKEVTPPSSRRLSPGLAITAEAASGLQSSSNSAKRPRTRSRRLQRVVESSQASTQPTQTTALPPKSAEPANSVEITSSLILPEHPASSPQLQDHRLSPPYEPGLNTTTAQDLLINITQPSDFDPENYQPFSSSFATQRSETQQDLPLGKENQEETQESRVSSANSSPLLPTYRHRLVVPDSQTSLESSSFDPAASIREYIRSINDPENVSGSALTRNTTQTGFHSTSDIPLVSDPIEDPSSSEAEQRPDPINHIAISSEISESSASTPPPADAQEESESQALQGSHLSSSEESQFIALQNSQELPAGQGNAILLPSFSEEDPSSFAGSLAHPSKTLDNSSLQKPVLSTALSDSPDKESGPAFSHNTVASNPSPTWPSHFSPSAEGLSDIRPAQQQSRPRHSPPKFSVDDDHNVDRSGSGPQDITAGTAFRTQISHQLQPSIEKESGESLTTEKFLTQPLQSFETSSTDLNQQARQVLPEDLNWQTGTYEETITSEANYSFASPLHPDRPSRQLALPREIRHPRNIHSSAGFESVLDALGQSGRVLSSSTLPTAPSEAPDTFLSNHQNRPQTPEDEDMSDLPQHQASSPSSLPAGSPGAAVRERLRALRAATASARGGNTPSPTSSPMSTQPPLPRIVKEGVSTQSPVSERSPTPADLPEGAKSPSVIPDRPPLPPPSSLLAPKSVRVHDFHTSHAPAHHSPLALHKERASPEEKTMDLPRLGQMEFIVSLGMDARARDQYAQTIYNYKDAIEGFAGIRDDEESSEDKSSDDEVLRSGLNPEKSPTSWLPQIKEMLSRAENVVNHNDLDDDGTMTQEHVSPEDEAIWAVQCSTKFEFLKYLLERFRPHEVHLAILAKPGRLLDIIETFLKGLHIVYTRPDTMSRSDATASGYLRVGLLATGETGAAAMVGSADLVIAFDSSFSVHDHQVQGLRSTFFEMHKLSPVIHLTVINSVEHVKRCLPSNVQGIERLQLAVRAITHLRHEAGELSSEFPHTEAAAEKVFEFVDGGSIESEWQLPPLTDVVSMELLAESQSSNSTSRSGTSSEIRQGAQKRPLTTEDEHEPTSTKRIRHSPGAENILSSGIDATHVSESIVEQAETPGQDSSTRNESQKEAELRTIIETAQSRLQEHILALEELQTRHEEQREEIHRLRKEREAVRIAMAQSERRRETQLGEISKLKDEKASLQKELDDARTALANSTVPEIAELETARAEARHNLEAKLHFERKVDSVQRDFEFTRTQYQNASSAAFEASQETASLRDENEALKQKASGEAVKLKQMNAERANSLHLDRISELEATLLERDELIKKKDEDLTRLRGRGGLTTRATSVPRSPRSVSRASSPNPAGIGNGGLGISRATYLRNA